MDDVSGGLPDARQKVHREITDALEGVLGKEARISVASDDSCKHVELQVCSGLFRSKGLQECHRMVLDALSKMIDGGTLHAVSIRTAVPEASET